MLTMDSIAATETCSCYRSKYWASSSSCPRKPPGRHCLHDTSTTTTTYPQPPWSVTQAAAAAAGGGSNWSNRWLSNKHYEWQNAAPV